MPRSIWKGSIAFGLVSIPVELHTAVRDHRPKFRMLHARDKSPVRYERVNSDTGAAHVAFKVDDIDAAYQALLAKQVRFTAAPATVTAGPMKGWRWTYFFDPDGIPLELIMTD